LLIGAGLEVEEEYVITDADGNFIARVDFRLSGEWVVVEVEGRANHSSKVDWEHDLTRRNHITGEGWGVIHATADKVNNHPEEFLAEVHRARASQARLRGRRAGSSA
jgi:very-short-patch-repair endonuclease